ncbi:MAG: preprotein translocase subunit SecG [Burkholderiaceae bacterium]|nr:preprotein translocase subunit SecG [Burkholderiaceae bacterium]
MQIFYSIVVVLQVLSALVIIGLVLLQHGKGADMGASFGSGASGSLFGATGSSNFLSKSTGIAAAIFFGATLALVYIGSNRTVSVGVMENVAKVPEVKSATGEKNDAAPASAVNQNNQIPK